MNRYIRSLILSLLLSFAVLLSLAPGGMAAEEEPCVNLDVCALDSDSGTFAVGQKFTWILRGSIPSSLKGARSYVLSFRPDPRLTLESGSTMVILHTADGRQRPLRAREHYLLEEGSHIRLSLTPAGMAYTAALRGKGSCTPELRISFRASINRTATMGATIPGEGSLRYCNAAGTLFEADSDRPEVHTGGLRVQLTDAAQSPLKGGTFRLARPATETDRVEDTLYLDGKKTQVVFVPFFATADMSEAPVTTLTTDDEGRALAFGLPYGTYFLVQTAAPLGYQILTTPIPVTVNAASHLTKADGWENRNEETVDNTVVIVNTPFALPETGSRGRILLTLLTAIALGLTLLNYRKLPITETQA